MTDIKLNTNKIQEFLNKAKENQRGFVEFEIRIGEFIKNENNVSFKSANDPEFFYNLKNQFDKHGFESVNIKTIEYIYKNEMSQNKRSKIKKIINENKNQVTYIVKNSNFMYYDDYDYGFRMSLSSEYNTKNTANLVQPEIIRKKNRFSYKIPNVGSLDLTIVETYNKIEDIDNGISKLDYEVELEVDTLSNLFQIEKLLFFIGVLLKTKQNNHYVITERNRRDVLKLYSDLVNKDAPPYKKYEFVGAQPETLQKDQLSILYKEVYTVTDKADGNRFLMLIDNNKNVYFIDNNIKMVTKTNLVSNNYVNSIIDGELIRINNQIYFYAFDLVCFNGNDIRGNNEYLFTKRLDILKEIVNSIQSNEFYVIKLKQFIIRNVFMGAEIIMENINNKPYKNDGLIFTPLNEPYPKTSKWSKLLKWKPSNMNTIDFYSVKNGNVWELYVKATKEQDADIIPGYKYPTHLVKFDINKYCNDIPKDKNEITFQTTFDDTLLDPDTKEPFKTNTVIEFRWDESLSKFMPLRTRWDKTINYRKHGNHVVVACDIWKSIIHPITINDMYKMSNASTSNKNTFFFERLNKHYMESFGHKMTFNNMLNLQNSLKKIDLISNSIIIDLCKSQETLNNFIQYLNNNLHNNEQISIIVIFNKDIPEKSILETSNTFSYYIGVPLQKKDMTELKLYITDNKNNICSIEKKYFENFLYMNGYKIEYIKPESNDCIVKLFTQCNIQKKESQIPKIYKKEYIYTKNQNIIKFDNKNLQFYKIKNTHDILNILSCNGNYIYKNKYDLIDFSDKDPSCVLDIIDSFIKRQLKILNESNVFLYIYHYVHELEQKELVSEPILQHYYYIVTYNFKYLLDKAEYKKVEDLLDEFNEIKHKNIKSTEINTQTHQDYSSDEQHLHVNINFDKVTIIQLKEYIKKLNDKHNTKLLISGNKDVLISRIKTFLDNSN